MSVARKSIAELRRDLAKRFPSAARTAGRVLPTGLAAIDDAVSGESPVKQMNPTRSSRIVSPGCTGVLSFERSMISGSLTVSLASVRKNVLSAAIGKKSACASPTTRDCVAAGPSSGAGSSPCDAR